MARKNALGLLLAASLGVTAMALAPPALSVGNSGTFELDGNVADNPGVSGDDWSTIYAGGGTPVATTVPRIVPDPAPGTIFTGGGSKDDLDIPNWKWKNGSVPDKDDITNAFAAAYNVNGELVIYAGADRLDNSGDAFIGFWFFQNSVSPVPITSGNSAGFTGTHTPGDTLVLANFTGGGTTVTVEVYKWVASGGNVGNNLLRVASSNSARCDGTDQPFCAITNADNNVTTPPWTYLSKSGTPSYPTATFFEIGVNISRLFPGSAPCFSSFAAETRSSSSVSAVLKDFVSAGFPVCGVNVTKVCKSPQVLNVTSTSAQVRYTIEGRVENQGFGTLTNVSLVDNPTADGAFAAYNCAGDVPDGNASIGGFPRSLAGNASVCYRSTITYAAITPTTPPADRTDTVTVTAGAGGGTLTDNASATCPIPQLSPSLSVTKLCDTTLDTTDTAGRIVVKANIAGSVCNESTTRVFNVQVTDTDVQGNLLPANTTLEPKGSANSCKDFASSYYPASALNRLAQGNTTVPGLAFFSDTVTATGTNPFGSVTPQTADASCTLCPTCTNAGDQCTGTSCPQTRDITQPPSAISTLRSFTTKSGAR